MIFLTILFVAIGLLAWIRLAPSDPAVWHVDPMVTADQDLAGGVRRRIPATEGAFEQLNGIILATPRTDVLAGTPAEGRVTYVTRSQWMGFPDYTTVQQNDGQLEIWGRLRFGTTDMGVNRARVDGWLEQLRAAQAEG
ncbi:DUF1499 domain-containing protein [Tropicibacter oceani]|uniref:DUF1499 domain-containing protein n=1 Tax=Tropicibacter oceani TaxID=3058420 RepID=A0ABY8QEQ0_9RHOB|nr:DUF1499 domain-containing protein [Tropicibacter oceani]WGW02483.1 DUF1499 domain-containing protein [Tropicibacter oceani]